MPEVPQFGALLRSHITSVPDAARPAFLAGLERSAAARYREWADAAPAHAEALLGCAEREDEIATLVAELFPISPADQAAVDAALPAAVAVYYEVFAPYDVEQQLFLQSEAELQGAQAWVQMTETVTDPAARDTLARCTTLEQESSHVVKDLLANWQARAMTRTIDTGTDDLLAEVDGHLGIITFNRPDRRNALSDPMYAGFERALPAMAVDPEVRVLVVTGAGGAFCAGGDVKGMNEAHRTGTQRPGRSGGVEDQVVRLRRSQRAVSLALHEFPKPVVAVLPGAAAGAGLSIALAADLRVAAERAVIVTAFKNVGASGDFGGSWFLTHLVGTAKAKELYFTSPRLTAREAMAIGMVNAVLADDDFEEQALDWCRRIAAGPPIAMRLMKENLNRALVTDLATALDAEAPNMIRSMSTADHREAAAAFVEKRSPAFTGE